MQALGKSQRIDISSATCAAGMPGQPTQPPSSPSPTPPGQAPAPTPVPTDLPVTG